MLQVGSREVVDGGGRLLEPSKPLFRACVVFLAVLNRRRLSGPVRDCRAVITMVGTRYGGVFMDVGWEHQTFSLGSTNAPAEAGRDAIAEAEAYLRRPPMGTPTCNIFPGESIRVPILRTVDNTDAIRLEVTDAPILRRLNDSFRAEVRIEGKTDSGDLVVAKKTVVVTYSEWNRPSFLQENRRA